MNAAHGQALEHAILANPDDLAAHAAYADWLIEQGNPRGEFVQVQLALEDPKTTSDERQRFRQRELELLEKHEEEWLGGLAPFLLHRPQPRSRSNRGWLRRVADFFFTPIASNPRQSRPRYQYSRGWLHSLTVPSLIGDLAQALARANQLRLLERLAIWYETGTFDGLADSPHLGNLRVFQLGESSSMDASGTRLIDFLKTKPRLEELVVTGLHIDTDALFSLPFPQLRVLQVDHLRHYPLQRLANNPTLGRLQRISFSPHAIEAGEADAYITLDGVRALLNSSNLPNLTHLELHLTSIGDPGCEAILQSGILRRLKVLDLSRGCITDAGARILAACPDLCKLELLNLEANGLTRDGIAALESVGLRTRMDQAGRVRLRVDHQHSAGELADFTYLYEGDIE